MAGLLYDWNDDLSLTTWILCVVVVVMGLLWRVTAKKLSGIPAPERARPPT